MKFIATLILLMMSLGALACWKIEGEILLQDYKIPVNQKFNHGQSYSFMKGPYIVHLQVKKEIHYEVLKKEKTSLLQVSKGSFPIEKDRAHLESDKLKFKLKLDHI